MTDPVASHKTADAPAHEDGTPPYRVEVLDAGDMHASELPLGASLIRVLVGEDAGGLRTDKLLADALPDLSRARVQTLIAEGQVEAREAPCTEEGEQVVDETKTRLITNASSKAQPFTAYDVMHPAAKAAEPEPQDIPLTVLFEDDHLIVINKPAGMVVHPAAGNEDGTLVNALLHHCAGTLSGIGGVARPGIVHRLDKETSGVMVAAKTDQAHKALAAQFASHGADGALERAYWALVWGHPRRRKFTIDAPLGRHPNDRKKMAVVSEAVGRRAVTHLEVKKRFEPEGKPVAALVECRLETGRTHQIRVHLTKEGIPVIGDPVYGRSHMTMANGLPEPAKSVANAFSRQALHAYLLGFSHPKTGEKLIFEADLPPDMAKLLACLEAL